MPDMEVDAGGGRQERVPINYPSNSHKDREAAQAANRPRPEPVVTATRERKRSIFGQVVHDFVQEDRHSLMEYVVIDVMLPAAKNLITDMISKGASRLFYGDDRASRSGGRPTGYYNYGGTPQGQARRADPRPPLTRQARATHKFNDVIIDTRGEAEDVLDGLRTLIDQYGSASVNDLYDLLNMSGDFTDNKWGWEDLRKAGVRAIRGGYVLDLPDTVPLAS